MSKDLKVSVITGLYNGERFILETAKSIFRQQGVDLEWIVIDDGSKDNGLEIVSRYAENALTNSAIVQFVKHEQNQGIKPTYFEGVKRSSGKYFKILDHDDVLGSPYTLARQVNLMEEQTNMGLAFSGTQLIDANGQPFKDKRYPFVDGQHILDKRVLAANILLN